jgi:hypothetical protein
MADQENFAESLQVSTAALVAAALVVREQMDGMNPELKAVNVGLIAMARKVTNLAVDLEGMVSRWSGELEGLIGPNVRAVFAAYSPAHRSIAGELYVHRGTYYAAPDFHHLVGGQTARAKTSGVKRGRDRIEKDFPGRMETTESTTATRFRWSNTFTPEEDEGQAAKVLAEMAARVHPSAQQAMEEMSRPEQVPEEVWLRHLPIPQAMLAKLIAQAGEAVKPHVFSELFEYPDASGTPTRISDYFRQLRKDPDLMDWLHRGGNGTTRYFMWGTAEQAKAIDDELEQKAAENYQRRLMQLRENYRSAQSHGRRSRVASQPVSKPDAPPKQRPPKTSQKTDIQPTPTPKKTNAILHREKLVSNQDRDAKRGAAVLQAWGLHDTDHLELREGDDLAEDIVHTAAEIDAWISPGEIGTILSEVRSEKVGVGAVLFRLDFLKEYFASREIAGWLDTGQVKDPKTERRRFRFVMPDELQQAVR